MSQPGAAIDKISFPILGLHVRVKKQRLGGPVHKSEEGAAAVGGVG